MCSSSSPVRIATRRPVWSRANRGVTSKPCLADSQAKRAPSRPSRCAAVRESSSRRMRYSSIARAAGGMGRGEERKDEDVAVPEDVAAVRGSGQPAGTDGGLARDADRRDQVEERQADCELQLRIGLDHDVGGLPTRRPGGTMLGQQTSRSRPPRARGRRGAPTARRAAARDRCDTRRVARAGPASGAARAQRRRPRLRPVTWCRESTDDRARRRARDRGARPV